MLYIFGLVVLVLIRLVYAFVADPRMDGAYFSIRFAYTLIFSVLNLAKMQALNGHTHTHKYSLQTNFQRNGEGQEKERLLSNGQHFNLKSEKPQLICVTIFPLYIFIYIFFSVSVHSFVWFDLFLGESSIANNNNYKIHVLSPNRRRHVLPTIRATGLLAIIIIIIIIIT